MKDHEVILTFGIWDFSEIDHAYITNLMGFEPNIIYRLGERRIPNKGQPSKRNGWLWRPEVVDKTLLDSFELQLNSILGKFENKIAELKQIEKYLPIQIFCVLPSETADAVHRVDPDPGPGSDPVSFPETGKTGLHLDSDSSKI